MEKCGSMYLFDELGYGKGNGGWNNQNRSGCRFIDGNGETNIAGIGGFDRKGYMYVGGIGVNIRSWLGSTIWAWGARMLISEYTIEQVLTSFKIGFGMSEI